MPAAGQWNDLEVDVIGQTYSVKLSGIQSTEVTNTMQDRGLPSSAAVPSFVGLQSDVGRIAFRHIKVQALP